MSMFEKFFGGPKDVVKEFEEKKPEETVPPVEPAAEAKEKRTPKTMEDVKQAVGDIQTLEFKRWETLDKHRDTVEELRRMGVNETNPDTVPRTETVKDILNPIEEELVAISTEINDKRREFDLQPNRHRVIDRRQHRLEELRYRAIEAFNKTPSGSKVKYIENQISVYEQNSNIYKDEIEKLKEEKDRFFETDKGAHIFKEIMDRIDRLQTELGEMLARSKQVDYDENGLLPK